MNIVVIEDYYNDFIQMCRDKADQYSELIHEQYDIICDSYKEIVEYKDFLKFHGLIDKIRKKCFNEISSIRIPDKYKNDEDRFYILIKQINAAKKKRINYIALYKDYMYLSIIPYPCYYVVLRSINYELSLELLKGNSIQFNGIGQFQMHRIPQTGKYINWGASLSLRDYLISQGITVMSKENPNGRAYLINGYDEDSDKEYHPIVVWSKFHAHFKKLSWYRFKFGHPADTYDNVIHLNTPEEIINAPELNPRKKLFAIYKKFYDYTLNTYLLKTKQYKKDIK